MTTPPETRHVTLMVTHPGGAGHLTLDHHIPAEAAEELYELVLEARPVVRFGRWVRFFAFRDHEPLEHLVEVSDATADRVIAAMRAHMPERDEHERQVRAAMGDQLIAVFQAMREEGESDMRTVIEHVRDAMRGES